MILKLLYEESSDMHNIYENIEEYKVNDECKILILFNATIADIFSNKQL